MKPVDLGAGASLEGEHPSERHATYHRGIASVRPILGTKRGHFLRLDCGHEVITFCDLALLDGRACCTVCRAEGYRRT